MLATKRVVNYCRNMEIENVRLAVICPDRGDRPLFLAQFHRQMERQTFRPEIVEVIDFPANNEGIDITLRYRTGYDKLRGLGFDIIAFCENDDAYLPNYLEEMVKGWVNAGRPDIFGTCYTIYYHLRIRAHCHLEHPNRSSMMSTLMKPDMEVDWPPDDYPYTDAHLWMSIKNRVTFRPPQIICLGIKHGMGLVGGGFHTDKLEKFNERKLDFKKIMGEENFSFYESLFDAGKVRKVRGKYVFLD